MTQKCIKVLYQVDSHNWSVSDPDIIKYRKIQNEVRQMFVAQPSADLLSVYPKIDLAPDAIKALLSHDALQAESVRKLSSWTMTDTEFMKMWNKSTYNGINLMWLAIHGAYEEKKPIFEYLNGIYWTNVTKDTSIMVEGDPVALEQVFAIYLDHQTNRDAIVSKLAKKIKAAKPN
jgi:hypothetical protein